MDRSKEQKNRQTDRQTDRNTNKMNISYLVDAPPCLPSTYVPSYNYAGS